jgi:hypothetical protein
MEYATGSADPHNSLSGVLTDQEIESVQLAQTIYGARAKEAAAGFAEAFGMEEPARSQFLGKVAVGVESLDFEQRRSLSAGLMELSALLGGQALQGANGSAPHELSMIGGGPSSALEAGSANGAGGLAGTERRQDSGPPLSQIQKTWLLKIVDSEAVDKVAALPSDLRITFAVNLGTRYQELAIRRASVENKQQRVRQLIALMAGKSYNEIAELTGATTAGARAGLLTMTGTLSDKLSTKDIIGCIPERSEEDGTFILAAEKPELSKDQRNWYAKLLDNALDVEQLADLTPDQQTYLAERLGARLRAANIRRYGPDRTERRVSQMTMLISGSSYHEIAETTEMNTAMVKAELHSIVTTLHRNISQEDLKQITGQALTHTAETTDGS